MTHPGQGTTNGVSLEDCYSNIFALADLCGIKWRRLSAGEPSSSLIGNGPLNSNSNRSGTSGQGSSGGNNLDPLEDPILNAYSKCLAADLLCVWRRIAVNRTDHHSGGAGGVIGGRGSSSSAPPDHTNFQKELWIFWYGQDPDLTDLLSSELSNLLNDVEPPGSWDNGLSYECRTLLFKALHNLIERHLLSRGFARLGKWFTQPLDGPDVDNNFSCNERSSSPSSCPSSSCSPSSSSYPASSTSSSSSDAMNDDSIQLGFAFNFFVHGESTVCASVDVRQFPAVHRLNKWILNAAQHKPINVILAPFGLAGVLTGQSHKDGDSSVQIILNQWSRFYPVVGKGLNKNVSSASSSSTPGNPANQASQSQNRPSGGASNCSETDGNVSSSSLSSSPNHLLHSIVDVQVAGVKLKYPACFVYLTNMKECLKPRKSSSAPTVSTSNTGVSSSTTAGNAVVSSTNGSHNSGVVSSVPASSSHLATIHSAMTPASASLNSVTNTISSSSHPSSASGNMLLPHMGKVASSSPFHPIRSSTMELIKSNASQELNLNVKPNISQHKQHENSNYVGSSASSQTHTTEDEKYAVHWDFHDPFCKTTCGCYRFRAKKNPNIAGQNKMDKSASQSSASSSNKKLDKSESKQQKQSLKGAGGSGASSLLSSTLSNSSSAASSSSFVPFHRKSSAGDLFLDVPIHSHNIGTTLTSPNEGLSSQQLENMSQQRIAGATPNYSGLPSINSNMNTPGPGMLDSPRSIAPLASVEPSPSVNAIDSIKEEHMTNGPNSVSNKEKSQGDMLSPYPSASSAKNSNFGPSEDPPSVSQSSQWTPGPQSVSDIDSVPPPSSCVANDRVAGTHVANSSNAQGAPDDAMNVSSVSNAKISGGLKRPLLPVSSYDQITQDSSLYDHEFFAANGGWEFPSRKARKTRAGGPKQFCMEEDDLLLLDKRPLFSSACDSYQLSMKQKLPRDPYEFHDFDDEGKGSAQNPDNMNSLNKGDIVGNDIREENDFISQNCAKDEMNHGGMNGGIHSMMADNLNAISPQTPRNYTTEQELVPSLDDLDQMFQSDESGDGGAASPISGSTKLVNNITNGISGSSIAEDFGKTNGSSNKGCPPLGELHRMFPTPPSLENILTPSPCTGPGHDSTLIDDMKENRWEIYPSSPVGLDINKDSTNVYTPPVIMQMLMIQTKYAPLTNLPSPMLMPPECVYKPKDKIKATKTTGSSQSLELQAQQPNLDPASIEKNSKQGTQSSKNHPPEIPGYLQLQGHSAPGRNIGSIEVARQGASKMQSSTPYFGSSCPPPYGLHQGPGNASTDFIDSQGNFGAPNAGFPPQTHVHGSPFGTRSSNIYDDLSTQSGVTGTMPFPRPPFGETPSPSSAADMYGLFVNLLLSDSLLNLFKDQNFESCTLCVCNMNIKGGDVGVYLPDSLVPGGCDEAQYKCTCGFSAVVNRHRSYLAGLFWEDEVETTGVIYDPLVGWKKKVLSVIESSIAANTASASSGSSARHESENPLEGRASTATSNLPVSSAANSSAQSNAPGSATAADATSNGGVEASNSHQNEISEGDSSINSEIVDLIKAHSTPVFSPCSILSIANYFDIVRHHLTDGYLSLPSSSVPSAQALLSSSPHSSNSPSSTLQLTSQQLSRKNPTYLQYQDASEIVLLSIILAKNSLRVMLHQTPGAPAHTSASDDALSLRGPALSEWPYSFARLPPNNLDIVRLLKSLQPLLQDSVQKKRTKDPWAVTYTVSGPLTWRLFHRLAGRGTEDQCEPQPIPSLLVGHDKDWLAISPLALKYWDKLMLEPHSITKDVAYIVVAPDSELILTHVKSFFKELSCTYETMRFGKHVPITKVLRDGVLRVGKSIAKKLADEPVDEFFNRIGDGNVAEKIKLYARACRHYLAPLLGSQSLDRTLFESLRPESGTSSASRMNSSQMPGSTSSNPTESSNESSSTSGIGGSSSGTSLPNSRPQNEDGQGDGSSHGQPGSHTNRESHAGHDWDFEDTPNRQAQIMIYLVEPFTLAASDEDVYRLACIGLMRCFTETLKALKALQKDEKLCNSVHVQMISLESILGVGREISMKRQDQLRSLSTSIFNQCRQHLTSQVTAKTLTGFGPAASLDAFLKTKDPSLNQRWLFTPPFILAPLKDKQTELGEMFGDKREKSSTLFCQYCLTEDLRHLVASATNEKGELLETIVINIEIPNRPRRRKATVRKFGLHKLMDFILSVMAESVQAWRLVIGRLGRVGHGELKEWAVILSKKSLQRYTRRLKEMCRQCALMNHYEMPSILSACLVSLEAETSLRVFPDQYTCDDKFSQCQQCPLNTPEDASCTHILVFPTSATTQSSQAHFSMDPSALEDDLLDQMLPIDEGNLALDGVDDVNDLFQWTESPTHEEDDDVRGGMVHPDSPNHQLGFGGGVGHPRGSESMGIGMSDEPLSLLQQPLALGYYVSTAKTGPLPNWFWASCPQMKEACPVFLKSALLIHVPSVQQNSDDFLHTNTRTSHSLDSNLTTDVLRYVLEGYNSLSWLALDASSHDRFSCLPFHIQVLMQVYNSVQALL